MIEDIKKWLESGGKDFDSGFAILKSISRNPFFMQNILRRRDIEKVRHELNKVYCQSGFAQRRKDADVSRRDAGTQGKVSRRDAGTQGKVSRRDTETRVKKVVESGSKVVQGESTGVQSGSFSDVVETSPLPLSTMERGKYSAGNDRVFLRKEFPFLEEGDCPEELKVLVADMITAHTKYQKGHDRLYDVANKDNDTCLKAAAEVVENYIENRLIWEELEYYRDNKKIMGKHRIFEARKRREEILKMGYDELKLLRTNLQRRIAYRKKQIKENRDDERVKEWMDEIGKLEREKRMASPFRAKTQRSNVSRGDAKTQKEKIKDKSKKIKDKR